MKSMLASLLLLVVACHAFAEPKTVSVTTPHGEFLFSAELQKDSHGLVRMVGSVTNKTTRNWQDLRFKATFYNRKGEPMSRFESSGLNDISIRSLAKGENRALGNGMGDLVWIKGKPADMSEFDIEFVRGTMVATYRFSLLSKADANRGMIQDLTLSDSLADFSFIVSKSQLGFSIRNNSDEPVELDWNKVAFVDVSGNSHKVMHSGVKFIAKAEVQPPTIIPPTAKIEDIIFPADYVHYEPGRFGGWQQQALFPDGEDALKYKGQTFSVFMPLKVNGTVKNYSFVFRIVDVSL